MLTLEEWRKRMVKGTAHNLAWDVFGSKKKRARPGTKVSTFLPCFVKQSTLYLKIITQGKKIDAVIEKKKYLLVKKKLDFYE